MEKEDKSTRKDKESEWMVFAKYVVSGATSVALQFGLLSLFVDILHLHATFSSTLAFLLASVYLYLMLYKWAFRHDGKHHVVAAKYAFVILIMLGLNIFIFWLLNEKFHVWYIYSQIVASTIVSLVNYVINRFYTFV